MIVLKLVNQTKLILLLLIFSSCLFAEEPSIEKSSITVAISYSPPWVIYDETLPFEEREPRGFSIDVWQYLTSNKTIQTQWLYQDSLTQVLTSVKTQEAEIGLVNFPPSSVNLGLQIAVLAEQSLLQSLQKIITTLTQQINFSLFLIPLAILLIAANLRWIIDRLDKNNDLFSKNYFAGVHEAVWWIIGLLIQWDGPKANHGFARLFDFAWHMIGLLALTGLIGVITSTLTLDSVNQIIKTEEDLNSKKIAFIEADKGYSLPYIQKLGAEGEAVKDLTQGLEKLLKGEVAAVIDNTKLLNYQVVLLNNKNSQQIKILPNVFQKQDYGVVVGQIPPSLTSIHQDLLTMNQVRGLEPSYYSQLVNKWLLEFPY